MAGAVSVKGGGEVRTPFKDAIFKPKGGIGSPAPVNPNKTGKK